jgi:RecA-family ATPase
MTRARSYAGIVPTEPDWLATDLIQLAGVTYVLGEGGVGKSFVTADWAMRVTTGAAFPGDTQEPLPAGSVILVSAEDDPNLSMSWRLQAAGADMARVYDMTNDFELPDSLPALREDLEAIGDVRLVVIDPLADVSSIPITSGAVRIRRVLTRPLQRFATDTGAAVVVVHHTTKAGRMAGSAAIQQAARMVLRVSRSAQDERIRTIGIEKTNVAADTATLAYTLAGEGLDTHVEYLAVPDGVNEPAREASVPDRVLAALTAASGPLQTQELARKVRADYGGVRTALTRLKATGLVVSPKRGYWTTPRATEPDGADLELVASVTA